MAVKIGSGGTSTRMKANVNVAGDIAKLAVLEGEYSGRTFSIFKEDFPAYMVNAPTGDYFLRMNADITQMYSATPAIVQSYFMVLDSFQHQDDAPPTPWVDKGGKTITMKDGKTFVTKDRLMFTVNLRIVAAEYTGFLISHLVPYAFQVDEGSEETMIAGTGRNKCEEFLGLVGLDFLNDTIPFSDNVLPFLEPLLVGRKVVLIAEVNDKGYIASITRPPVGIPMPEITA